jgi:hypothetical protein
LMLPTSVFAAPTIRSLSILVLLTRLALLGTAGYAFPVAEMSWPSPAVVLRALNRAVAPDVTRRLRRTTIRLLRIGNSPRFDWFA